MDILTPHGGLTNEKICKAQIEAVEKKQNEYKLIGRLTKVPGHTLYKFNATTREASKAEMRTEIIRQYDPDTDTVIRHVKSDVKVEKDCYYSGCPHSASFSEMAAGRPGKTAEPHDYRRCHRPGDTDVEAGNQRCTEILNGKRYELPENEELILRK